MNFDAMKNLMDRLTAWRMPGNAICVYKDGKEVFRYQSGYADLENKIPMTPEHHINIYSCSKVTTVTAALQLYERGDFLLNTQVREFLPEYADVTVRHRLPDGSEEIRPATRPVLMRDLFAMSAGLTYDTNSPAFQELNARTGGAPTTREVAAAMAKSPLMFEPGEHWNYSMCHDVLAAVV
jgi:CubicO group peptidase (beta-lactamase class C family)